MKRVEDPGTVLFFRLLASWTMHETKSQTNNNTKYTSKREGRIPKDEWNWRGLVCIKLHGKQTMPPTNRLTYYKRKRERVFSVYWCFLYATTTRFEFPFSFRYFFVRLGWEETEEEKNRSQLCLKFSKNGGQMTVRQIFTAWARLVTSNQ